MANCWSRAQPVSSGEVLFYWQESCNAPFIGWSIFVTIVSVWCIYPVQTWVLCIFVYSLSLAVIFCPSTLPEGLWTQPCCLLGDISEVFLLVQTSKVINVQWFKTEKSNWEIQIRVCLTFSPTFSSACVLFRAVPVGLMLYFKVWLCNAVWMKIDANCWIPTLLHFQILDILVSFYLSCHLTGTRSGHASSPKLDRKLRRNKCCCDYYHTFRALPVIQSDCSSDIMWWLPAFTVGVHQYISRTLLLACQQMQLLIHKNLGRRSFCFALWLTNMFTYKNKADLKKKEVYLHIICIWQKSKLNESHPTSYDPALDVLETRVSQG